MKKYFFLILVFIMLAHTTAIAGAKEKNAMIKRYKIAISSACERELAKKLVHTGNKNFLLFIIPDCESNVIVQFDAVSKTARRVDKEISPPYEGKSVAFSYDDGIIVAYSDKYNGFDDPIDFYRVLSSSENNKLQSIKCESRKLRSMYNMYVSRDDRVFVDDGSIYIVENNQCFDCDEIIKGKYLENIYYDKKNNIEYTGWYDDRVSEFKIYNGTGYTDVAVYRPVFPQGVWGKSMRSFIVGDDFFVVEEVAPREDDIHMPYRIMHLKPGKEAALVGYFVMPRGYGPHKIIALPDGWFALLFDDGPGIIKFKPGSSTYFWHVMESKAGEANFVAQDIVFAEGSFWLFGNQFYSTAFAEVPEKELIKGQFSAEPPFTKEEWKE